ncbi:MULTISPECIES: CDC48 family AAA ATPase [Methylobacterium]|jgi:transitional endoplasmic reticulum ATPase|uniref:ATP-dependent zinc metalloprotease FtsH n=1 Tax=Methylobacterium isbiliense TaxID=315478 RepID=A0ABQ4SE53_9HYPH|nr:MULTISPECIES: CDC48 family AAA ATPase [Methylobacterium]MBY0295265.1 CDC48 family AAA ATPase [Methylobacterium sp.]MDN3622522.1 CDC48 family AAA ATPase [Methylobacterium isbiliense]GJE01496.1 ATP-dependent zinc metalloprotease FtsH [Methylobacterium isbiliense]
MADETGGVRAQVANARAQDVGRGVARIGAALLDTLKIQEGEAIEIIGKRHTTALAIALGAEDEGLSIIRLDGLQRVNAGVGSGDYVEIRRAEVRPAQRVVLAPAQKNLRLQGSGEALRRTFFRRPLIAGDVISTSVQSRTGRDQVPEELRSMFNLPAYGLQEIRLVVVSTLPARGIVQITAETEVDLRPLYEEPKEARRADVTYDDIGGLGSTVDQVREMVELPLRHPELFQRLGIDPPKGVLLYGPPGTGKTLLARAVANETEAQFFHIAGPEIMGSQYGESEQRLRQIFSEAQRNAPAIVFIDEIDSIAPKREEARGEVERRIVAQLLTLMDGLEPRQNIVVIGATNRRDAIDEALRRPGRFDREIVIGVPDEPGRREVLTIHTRGMPLGDNVDLDEIARTTYGFVGADLSALAREAAMDALRRVLPRINLKEGIPPEVLETLQVCREDFLNALKRVQPSALREIMIQVPNVGWDDVGGLGEVQTKLREGVELPLRNPEAFRRIGIRPAKGFLLFGPPGTGKTLLAKAVAREAQANFVATKSSDLLSKWYGESEQQVSRLFARARQVAPTVIFIDEVDSLAPVRGGGLGEPAVTERVVNTILTEMDGLEELQGVVVIAATNRPNLVDPALLRPGRFDELVYVPVPNAAGRRHILGIHTRAMPLGPDVDLDDLAARTVRFTGADLEDLTRRAGLMALRADLEASAVTQAHFDAAFQETRPSVTPEMEQDYETMLRTLKQEGPQRQPIGFVPSRPAAE